MSLCDHLNSKPLLVCNVHVHCNLCGACEYHLGAKGLDFRVLHQFLFLKNWATEIQLRTRNVSNHMWSKCPSSSTMKRYPYSTKLPKVDVMALQVICALLYLTLSQNSDQKSLVSTTERGQKSVGTREIRDLGNCCKPIWWCLSFSNILQHRTNSHHSLWGCQAIVTNLQITWGMGEGCGVLFHEMLYTGVMPYL